MQSAVTLFTMGDKMERKIAMYLEEYARILSDEVLALLEREREDGDADAGEEAKELAVKVADIRRAVVYITNKAY